MKKNSKKIQDSFNKDGFIEVPTYLFPQGEEYAQEIIYENEEIEQYPEEDE